eukprot:9547950-Alexandrium_andersonii.AAC.1
MRSPCPWQARSSRESQCAAPPSEPEQHGRRRGCAEAWRTYPAGPLPEGAQGTRPRRHKRANGLSARG